MQNVAAKLRFRSVRAVKNLFIAATATEEPQQDNYAPDKKFIHEHTSGQALDRFLFCIEPVAVRSAFPEGFIRTVSNQVEVRE